MRILLIKLLCSLTRRLPFLHLDTLAQTLLVPEISLESVITYNTHSRIRLQWKQPREWSLYRTGLFEPNVTMAIKQYMPHGGYAVDIGANIGLHTLTLSYLAGDFGRVIAVEPNHAVRSRLEQNLSLNTFANNVAVCSEAAGASEGESQLFIPEGPTITGKASLTPHNGENWRSTPVKVTTVDMLLDEHHWQQLDLIKCDIEGHDLEALQGAQATLKSYHPVILVEYNQSLWSNSGYTFTDLYDFLNTFDYRLSWLPPHHWRGVIRPAPIEVNRNFPKQAVGTKLDILAKIR